MPENVRYTTENGRNVYRFKIVVVGEGEPQIMSSDQGVYATGVKEGDTFIVGLTAVTNTDTWAETDMSTGVEVTYTKENVESQKTFK